MTESGPPLPNPSDRPDLGVGYPLVDPSTITANIPDPAERRRFVEAAVGQSLDAAFTAHAPAVKQLKDGGKRLMLFSRGSNKPDITLVRSTDPADGVRSTTLAWRPEDDFRWQAHLYTDAGRPGDSSSLTALDPDKKVGEDPGFLLDNHDSNRDDRIAFWGATWTGMLAESTANKVKTPRKGLIARALGGLGLKN
jgi:hypothetical protein